MPIAWPLRPSVPRVGHAALPRPPWRFPLVGLRSLATTPLMGRVASSALQGLIGAHRGIAHQPATYALQQVRALYLCLEEPAACGAVLTCATTCLRARAFW
jgi:hypothetical protein